MQRTLIAVFDNRGDAQSAIDALVAAGFPRQEMKLSQGDPTGAPSTPDTSHSEGIVDSIKHFLSSMFGTDDSEYVQKYSDAVTRGHHVLTLTATDEPEVERAADIVERFGPVDIDEKTAQWSGGALASDAMRTGAGAQQQSASMSQQSMGGAQGSAQGMTGSAQAPTSPSTGIAGSMQDAGQQGSQQFFEGAAGAMPVSPQRAGVRVFEHMEDTGLGTEADTAEEVELYYRKHYDAELSATGDHYEAYEPAYRYGSDMASSETYRGRAWKDVEPALRSDWEGKNPGSAWEKTKAAVRHGWEKITS
ncbi:MAG: hypothetical protein JWQ01_2339 [Massilia sp.]|nr:hypothetical protein [Massilia sp.]